MRVESTPCGAWAKRKRPVRSHRPSFSSVHSSDTDPSRWTSFRMTTRSYEIPPDGAVTRHKASMKTKLSSRHLSALGTSTDVRPCHSAGRCRHRKRIRRLRSQTDCFGWNQRSNRRRILWWGPLKRLRRDCSGSIHRPTSLRHWHTARVPAEPRGPWRPTGPEGPLPVRPKSCGRSDSGTGPFVLPERSRSAPSRPAAGRARGVCRSVCRGGRRSDRRSAAATGRGGLRTAAAAMMVTSL